VRQGLAAGSYCSTTLAGIRRQALAAMPWSFAHARILPLCSRLAEVRPGRAALSPTGLADVFDEWCELVAERRGVLPAQVDPGRRAADPEAHCLLGAALS
jgi:hypothetical protein